MRKGFLLLYIYTGLLLLPGAFSYGGEKLHLKFAEVDLRQAKRSIFQSQTAEAVRTGRLSSTQYYLIQFDAPLKLEEKEILVNSGIKILRYIPDDGYVVQGERLKIENLKNAGLHLVGFAPYVPEYRLSSDLQTLSVFHRARPANVQLYLFPSAKVDELADIVANQGMQVIFKNERMMTVRAPLSKVPELAKLEGVEWVQEKQKYEKFDYKLNDLQQDMVPHFAGDYSDLTGYETGLAVMNAHEAWQTGLTGKTEFVVAADTGLDTGNFDTLSADFYALNLIGLFGLGTDSWADTVGHGTHVLGSVGSSGYSSNGAVTGGAYRATLGMQAMWSTEHEGLTVPDDIRTLFHQAYVEGSRIHTNSWGSSNPFNQGRYEGDAAMVDEFAWDHPDMLILFAAGNDGADRNRDGRIDPGSVSPPATAKNSLSVGASENYELRGGIQEKIGKLNPRNWGVEPIASDTVSNNPNGLVAFSARGPTTDGRIKPDVVAPGSNILSNCSKVPESGELWGRYNDKHCFSGGTSMSTPLVAGAAALVRERLGAIQGIENPSSALVKAVLMHTAFDMFPGQFGAIGEAAGQEILTPAPNFDEGYGRVDIGRAVNHRMFLIDEHVGVGTGEAKEYLIEEPINKITLVYTDYPGSLMAKKALVNNLTLHVVVGSELYQVPSNVDNSEQVVLSEAVAPVRVIVYGTNVPMGREERQPFSLVISKD